MKDLSNELEKIEIYENNIIELEENLKFKELEIEKLK